MPLKRFIAIATQIRPHDLFRTENNYHLPQRFFAEINTTIYFPRK
jgi:hypothetical protein